SGSTRLTGPHVMYSPENSKKSRREETSLRRNPNTGRSSTSRYSDKIRSSYNGVRASETMKSTTRPGEPWGLMMPDTSTLVSITTLIWGFACDVPHGFQPPGRGQKAVLLLTGRPDAACE